VQELPQDAFVWLAKAARAARLLKSGSQSVSQLNPILFPQELPQDAFVWLAKAARAAPRVGVDRDIGAQRGGNGPELIPGLGNPGAHLCLYLYL